jgi:hypothetical protein
MAGDRKKIFPPKPESLLKNGVGWFRYMLSFVVKDGLSVFFWYYTKVKQQGCLSFCNKEPSAGFSLSKFLLH